MSSTYVRWMCTQWCNYTCFYCPQNHERKQVYKGSPGHWADVRPWQEWAAAFRKHFPRMVLHMTGGEPMLDRVNTQPLLEAVADFTDYFEIDTNGSFTWDSPIREKAALHVSYHPTMVTPGVYLDQIRSLRDRGWRVMMSAFVVLPNTFSEMRIMAYNMRQLGIPMNVMTKDGKLDGYSPAQVEELRKYIPAADWYHAAASPAGKMCNYPSVAYEVDPDGSVIVPCHRKPDPRFHGSLWTKLPELFQGYIPCPKKACSCEERYTHLQEIGLAGAISPKEAYASRIRTLQWQ